MSGLINSVDPPLHIFADFDDDTIEVACENIIPVIVFLYRGTCILTDVECLRQ